MIGIESTNPETNIDATRIADGSVDNTTFQYLNGTTSNVQSQINAKQSAITGAASTIATTNLTASKVLISDSNGKVAASTVTSAELIYLSGTTSPVQTQLDGKQASITGGASTITSNNLTATRVLISDTSGKVAASSVNSTELGYLSGVTSNIQTQINNLTTSSLPAGTVIWCAKSTVPTGYLECNGAAISRTTYSSLFLAIGTTFGSGDGSITFNIPDLRGEFIRGWDDGAGIDAGRTFGSSQTDAFQNFTANFKQAASSTNYLAGAVRFIDSLHNGVIGRIDGGSDSNYTAATVQIDPSISARTDIETRPCNIAMLPCIKY